MSKARHLLPDSYLWLILILLLGFALRIYGLGDIAVNSDESIDYRRYIGNSFQAIVVDELVLNNQSFAHILSRTALLTLGDKLFSLRWPALIISMLGVAAIYRLGQGLFGRRVGLIAALLLALSPYAIFFAHSFRGYSGVINLPILVYLLGFLALKTERWRYWLGLGLLAAAMLYTHLFTTLAYLNLLLLLGLLWLAGQRWPGLIRPALPKLAASLAITAAMLLALYAPIWLKLLNPPPVPGTATSDILWVQRPSVSASVWYNLWLYNGYWQSGSQGGHGVFVLLALSAIGVWLGWANKARGRVLLLLGWAFAPFAELWLLQTLFDSFWARPPYLGYTLPSLLILAAVALAWLPAWSPLQKLPPRVVHSVPILLLLLLCPFWYMALREYYQVFAGADWQAIGNFLQRRTAANDLVVCQEYAHAWRDVDIGAEDLCTRTLNYRAKADTPMISEVLTVHQLVYKVLPEANRGLINRQGRVWLVVWNMPDAAQSFAPEANGVTVTEFNQLGRSAVMLAGQPATYVTNLATAFLNFKATTALPDQQFIYSLMAAILASASGQTELAATQLDTARQNMPPHPEGAAKLARTEAIVATLAPVAIDHPLEANFSDTIMLHGYNLNPDRMTAGSNLKLTLFWQAIQPIRQDLRVFVHVRDQAGRTITQLDYQPFDGSYPTQQWQPGQLVLDSRQFQLPADITPGEYSLMIGFYDPLTMERLSLLDDKSGENALALTSIRIFPQ